MSTLLNVMIILFVLIGIVAIIFAYRPVWTEIQNRNGIVQSEEVAIRENLKILRENNDAAKKAIAFIILMELSYVLVHTIVNQGNNYDDKKQTKNFCESLTPQLIDSLNTTEGKYE